MTDDDRRFASLGRALALVERGLRDGLDVAAMAEAACYSLFHFVRVFTELTGHGPYDYLMRRRVAEAAREVVSGTAPILDIALEYRFESPEGFSRAFRRCFGLTPSEARKAGAYPEGSARTPITEGFARASREAGIAIRAEALADTVIAGHALRPGATPDASADVILVGPGGGRFAGRVSEGDEPAFPLLAARVPGGTCMRASGVPPLDLSIAREWLYRAAFPVSGASPRGDLEIVRLDDGSPAALVVPTLATPA